MLHYEVRVGGGPYVAGEENALFESIQGCAPVPRKDQPAGILSSTCGLFYKPTFISNAETFANIPHIIEQGAKIFKDGKHASLLSVTGDVPKPMIMECILNEYNIKDLISETKAEDIVAAEVGGCTEPLIFKRSFRNRLGFEENVLNAVGSVVLFNSGCNFSNIYRHKLKFMAEESCKQCVPCRDGSELFYRAYEELRTTGKTRYNMRTLNIAADSARRTSMCAHGKSLQALFKSARDYIISRKVY